jgi:hypothetical protein
MTEVSAFAQFIVQERGFSKCKNKNKTGKQKCHEGAGEETQGTIFSFRYSL